MWRAIKHNVFYIQIEFHAILIPWNFYWIPEDWFNQQTFTNCNLLQISNEIWIPDIFKTLPLPPLPNETVLRPVSHFVELSTYHLYCMEELDLGARDIVGSNPYHQLNSVVYKTLNHDQKCCQNPSLTCELMLEQLKAVEEEGSYHSLLSNNSPVSVDEAWALGPAATQVLCLKVSYHS